MSHTTPPAASAKLAPRDAAKRIGVSEGFLNKLRMTGEGPAFLKLGRKVLYEVAAVDAWLATKRTTKAPPGHGRGGRRKAAAPEGQHAQA